MGMFCITTEKVNSDSYLVTVVNLCLKKRKEKKTLSIPAKTSPQIKLAHRF